MRLQNACYSFYTSQYWLSIEKVDHLHSSCGHVFDGDKLKRCHVCLFVCMYACLKALATFGGLSSGSVLGSSKLVTSRFLLCG